MCFSAAMLPSSSRSCLCAQGSPRVAQVESLALASPCGSQHAPVSRPSQAARLMHAASCQARVDQAPHAIAGPRRLRTAQQARSVTCSLTFSAWTQACSWQGGVTRQRSALRAASGAAGPAHPRCAGCRCACCRCVPLWQAHCRPGAPAHTPFRAQCSPLASSQGIAQDTHIRVEGLIAERAWAGRCQAQQGRRNKSALALGSAAG